MMNGTIRATEIIALMELMNKKVTQDNESNEKESIE